MLITPESRKNLIHCCAYWRGVLVLVVAGGLVTWRFSRHRVTHDPLSSLGKELYRLVMGLSPAAAQHHYCQVAGELNACSWSKGLQAALLPGRPWHGRMCQNAQRNLGRGNCCG